MKLPLVLFLLITLSLRCVCAQSGPAGDLPHLQLNGQAVQLMVDGKPFLVLGGELHNSSSTSREYMKPLWPKLAQANFNTVLSVVPWDMVEPTEGKFDFAMVDQMLEDARSNHLHLVLLWFGSWKNGLSHYVPAWVKMNPTRFPHALTQHGTVEILSTFSAANRDADAKAFSALMRHVREVDAQHTVVMVQVENEVGLHGDYRDRSTAANAAFAQEVPEQLMSYLHSHKEMLLPEFRALWQSKGFKSSGTWDEVFGHTPAAEEAFMAWNYASYVGQVTAAGKAEYPIPMFVNAWIVQPEDEFPGEYPSGGPQAHVHDLWHAGAPKLDILAPDIYLPNFTEVCAQFSRSNSSLFIPESRNGPEGLANACVAIGRFNSLGYSPFGIDGPSLDMANSPLAHGYEILRQLAPLILDHQAKGAISGVSLNQQNSSQKIQLGNYVLETSLVTQHRSTAVPERAYGLVIAVGPDEYIVAGSQLQISFSPNPANDDVVGLNSVEEGIFENGKWIAGRRLNGDEVMISYDIPSMSAKRQAGTGLRFIGEKLSVMRVKLFHFPQEK